MNKNYKNHSQPPLLNAPSCRHGPRVRHPVHPSRPRSSPRCPRVWAPRPRPLTTPRTSQDPQGACLCRNHLGLMVGVMAGKQVVSLCSVGRAWECESRGQGFNQPSDRTLEMTSDARRMRESMLTGMLNIACARSQRNTKETVFWLAQMRLCVMTLRNVTPFFDKTFIPDG